VHRLGRCIRNPDPWPERRGSRHLAQRNRPRPRPHADLRKAIHGINTVYKSRPTIKDIPISCPTDRPQLPIANPRVFDFYRTRTVGSFLPRGYPRMSAVWANFLSVSRTRKHRRGVSNWDSEELDEAADEAGSSRHRPDTPDEWATPPSGQATRPKGPLVEIVKIGE